MIQKLFIFLALLILLPVAGVQQNKTTPTSKIVDVKQLFNDLKILSADDMQGRLAGTAGGAKAREYVLRRFKESGIKAFGSSYLQPFEFSYPRKPLEKLTGVNVVGFVKGVKQPDKYIVLTAHYDHVGVHDGKIYNGSDDNASGTAALFAVAKYFSKHRPASSVIFAALDNEEGGLVGARKLVSAPPANNGTIVMNVNLDMISRDPNNTLFAVGTYPYPYLKPYLQKIVSKVRVKLRFGHDDPNQKDVEDWTSQSDHAAFHQEKIPFIYFGDENYEHHHKPTDDFETMIPDFYVGAVETVIFSVREFSANAAAIEKHKNGTSAR